MTDNEQKVQILLDLLNVVLKSINKDPITHLDQFKNVKRKYIVAEEPTKYFESQYNNIFKHYDKKKCKFYERNARKQYIMIFIRRALNELGYKIRQHNNDERVVIDGQKLVLAIVLFDIIKK